MLDLITPYAIHKIFFLLFDAEPEMKSPLLLISSKGCEFQKPEQVAEMGERGRVEAVISSALAVGWHYKDCFCQGKRWKYSLPFSIFCTLKKAEVHTGIPKYLKTINFIIPLSLQESWGCFLIIYFFLSNKITFSPTGKMPETQTRRLVKISPPSYTLWVF